MAQSETTTWPTLLPHDTPANHGTSTRRRCLWASAGFVWVVWTLAVTTATHEEWVITSISGLGGVGPGDIGLLDVCNARDLFGSSDATSYLDTLCDLYRGFTATQLVATLTCSIAAAMIALAAFRPAVARCAAAKPLVTASGWVMIAHAIFQLKAATLAYFLLEEFDSQVDVKDERVSRMAHELGLTCWFALAGVALALVTSLCLLVGAEHAGDGPFDGCAGVDDRGNVSVNV